MPASRDLDSANSLVGWLNSWSRMDRTAATGLSLQEPIWWASLGNRTERTGRWHRSAGCDDSRHILPIDTFRTPTSTPELRLRGLQTEYGFGVSEVRRHPMSAALVPPGSCSPWSDESRQRTKLVSLPWLTAICLLDSVEVSTPSA